MNKENFVSKLWLINSMNVLVVNNSYQHRIFDNFNYKVIQEQKSVMKFKKNVLKYWDFTQIKKYVHCFIY